MTESSIFSGKFIVVGVCGGIAAYKSVELVRYLVDAGAPRGVGGQPLRWRVFVGRTHFFPEAHTRARVKARCSHVQASFS